MKSIKIISIFCFLFTALLSCNGNQNLEDFDASKLKRNYSFDITYTKEKFKELKKEGNSVDGFDSFTMLGLLTFTGDIVFYDNSKGYFSSVNRFDSSNSSGNDFQYKIESDSIIYLKVDDYDETTEDKYIKSAILIEYGKDYEYFIIKPINSDTYRNFEFKAIADK